MNKFTITDFRAAYPNDDACLDKIFELRYNNLVCPRCESDKKFTRVHDRRSYQCPACGFQIYPTKGTVFEKTTTPLSDWFLIIYMQTTTRNGVAAKEIERTLDVCYKTALRMAHQIKILMANKEKREPLTGVIECDETFIGGLNKNRHADKKVPKSQGRSLKGKTAAVFGMIKRDGEIRTQVIDNFQEETLKTIIDANINKEKSIVVTDDWVGYASLESNEYKHVILNHTEEEWTRGAFHTNTIEGVWSQLKRTIKGTHVKVSKKHLQKYVDEVAYRYMNRDKQDTMFEDVLSHVV